MKKITVYCEVDFLNKKLKEVSYQLISKAFDLSLKIQQMGYEKYDIEAVCLSSEIDSESIEQAYSSGADKFVLIKNENLNSFYQTVFANSFIEYYKDNQGDIIIFPATQKGRMVAPRITTMLHTGLVADCTDLDFVVKNNQLKFAPTRPTFGSELMATILSKTLPQCATVRPNVFKKELGKVTKKEYLEFNAADIKEDRVKITKTFSDVKQDKNDYSNTDIIFVAGYGLSDSKDNYFEKLQKIANKLGAKIGSTRKVVDMGLMTQNTQIGQTGSSVEAKIYVAFGVSGAIQHIFGMKNSKTIIAINNDDNADIFKYCDYKIVSDAKKIIDELLEKI